MPPTTPARPRLEYTRLFREAKELIQRDYWLFFGIAGVGYLIAGFVPLYICYGPMMCGVHHALRRQHEGKEVEFTDLFRGFDWFLPSLLVSLAKLGISFVLAILWIPLMLAIIFSLEAADLSQDQEALYVLLAMIPTYIVLFVVLMIVEGVFLYAFPLIADRGLSAGEAMKASLRAYRQNLWGTTVLVLLNGILWVLGSMCCVLPFFLVLPITYGIVWLAYREVFGAPPVAAQAPAEPEGA